MLENYLIKMFFLEIKANDSARSAISAKSGKVLSEVAPGWFCVQYFTGNFKENFTNIPESAKVLRNSKQLAGCLFYSSIKSAEDGYQKLVVENLFEKSDSKTTQANLSLLSRLPPLEKRDLTVPNIDADKIPSIESERFGCGGFRSEPNNDVAFYASEDSTDVVFSFPVKILQTPEEICWAISELVGRSWFTVEHLSGFFKTLSFLGLFDYGFGGETNDVA